MAETVKTTRELKINYGFYDGDYRLETIENPRNDLTSADIGDLSSWLVTNQVVLGDKAGARFVGINEAYIESKTDVTLDLSSQS